MSPSIVTTVKSLWKRMTNKEYRDSYVAAHISNTVSSQINLLREARGWTQKDLAKKAGMSQSRISALEDPNYENIEVGTLRRLASAFDVALTVRFIPYSELATWTAELSTEKMIVADFANDEIAHPKAVSDQATNQVVFLYTTFAAPTNYVGSPQETMQTTFSAPSVGGVVTDAYIGFGAAGNGAYLNNNSLFGRMITRSGIQPEPVASPPIPRKWSMAETPHITVKSVVVCDDVRREDNGKEILLGVYSGGVLVQSFPIALGLSFWVHFNADVIGDAELRFRLIAGSEVKFFEIRAKLVLGKLGLGSLTFGPAPVVLQVASTLELQMNQKGDDWETIYQFGVAKADPSQQGLPNIVQATLVG